VGDNKFDPTGVLTTCAFTKMVLCALGYKADVEGLTGESWAINAASLAVTAGISDSTIPMSSVTSCTREQACQIAYKALSAKLVKYTGGSTITVGGVSIVQGAVREDVTVADTVAETLINDNCTQFAEKYFTKLTKEPARLMAATATTGRTASITSPASFPMTLLLPPAPAEFLIHF
jgi:hypothetical protein